MQCNYDVIINYNDNNSKIVSSTSSIPPLNNNQNNNNNSSIEFVEIKIIKKYINNNCIDNNNSNNISSSHDKIIKRYELEKIKNSNNNNSFLDNLKYLKIFNNKIEIEVIDIISNNSDSNNNNNNSNNKNNSNHFNYLNNILVEVGSELRKQKKMEEALKIYYILSRISVDTNINSTSSSPSSSSSSSSSSSILAALNINNSTGYFYMGVTFYENGDHNMALESYKRALGLNPNYPEALCNVGVIYKNLGEIEMAIEYYQRALLSNPNYLLVKNNLAIAYNDFGTQIKLKGQIEKSKRYYKKSLFYNCKHAETYYNLGVLNSEQRKIEKAIIDYELAIHFNSNYTEALNNLGVIYKDIDNIEQSINYYQLALKSNPKFSQSLNNLAVIYTMQGKMKEAKQFIKQAIKESPTYAEAFNNLGVIYRDIGKIQNSIKAYEKCMQLSPNSLNAHHNKLLALNYSTNYTINEIYNHHQQWGKQFLEITKIKLLNYLQQTQNQQQQQSIALNNKLKDNNNNNKLIVGYISGDFFVHSVSYFIEGILKHHDKDQFKIICYSNVSKEDKTTERLKSYNHQWVSITGLSEFEVYEIIKKDNVDILVELSGHTCGNRMDVMALQPSPIQISYIGYPNTTGLETIQYRFTDSIVDPLDTKQLFTESLVRLPQCFLTYFPPLSSYINFNQDNNNNSNQDYITPLPVLNNGFITFGSFNIMAKYSDKCLNNWRIILERSPPSTRLLLKSKPFACEKTKQSFYKRLSRLGFNINQIDLIGLFPQQKDHLLYYKMMDISLDTFPYSGTTTTCEALWMGIPVITLSQPNCHSHNVGKSILTCLGLQSLIANSESQFIDIALKLSNDIDQLLAFRKNLRNIMLNSPLCDNLNFTKNLELKYKMIYNYHHSNNNNNNIHHQHQNHHLNNFNQQKQSQQLQNQYQLYNNNHQNINNNNNNNYNFNHNQILNNNNILLEQQFQLQRHHFNNQQQEQEHLIHLQQLQHQQQQQHNFQLNNNHLHHHNSFNHIINN